jgi:TBC1 domain family member 20
VITWYVHSVENMGLLTRLFDYFIADATGNAVIYFTAAFVMSQRKTIFEWIHSAKDETGVSTDIPEGSEEGVVLMARVYAQLSRLPSSALQSMDADTLEGLISQADQFATLHYQVVEVEEENFLRGEVKKIGMLSNLRTRNAALRLLWHFLPREWRNPAKVERVRRFFFWTSVMVAATAVVVGTAAADAKQGGWVRNFFH